MPRYASTQPSKPFARVLSEFMWKQRPPWSSGMLARQLKVSRQTTANWLYHGVTPNLETMFEVMKLLGIPLETLLQAYAEDGVSIPEFTPPEPKPYEEDRQPTANEWETMLEHTRKVLTSIMMDEDAIEMIIRHVRQTREQTAMIQRQLFAEHVRESADDSQQNYRTYDERDRPVTKPR